MIVYVLFVHKKSVTKRKVCIIFIKNLKFKKPQKTIFSGFFQVGYFGRVFYWQPCLQPAAHQALQADEPQHLVQPPSRRRLLARQVFNGLCRERGIREKTMKKIAGELQSNRFEEVPFLGRLVSALCSASSDWDILFGFEFSIGFFLIQ
jgi:hypothetical protein